MNPYLPPPPKQAGELSQTQEECKVKACIVRIIKAIASVPLCTKLVIAITLAILLFQENCRCARDVFGADSREILRYHGYYRLVTNSFVILTLENIALAFIVWIPKAIKYEKSIGTLRYAFLFLINATVIQVIHLILQEAGFAHLFYDITNRNFYHRNTNLGRFLGFLPYAFMEMTMDFLANRGKPVQILCLPFKGSPLIVPLVAFIICTALNGINLFVLIGIAYGVVFYYLLRSKMYISDENIEKMERACPCSSLANKLGFVSSQSAVQMQISLECESLKV